MSYTSHLPQGISLQIFDNETLIYESNGKWLHPLFDFENFLKTYDGPKDNLAIHDTVIGKAAAVLTLRAGITKINAELISELAKNYIAEINASLPQDKQIQVQYTNVVPKILCATETQLENLHDSEQMYHLLRQRAHLE